MIAPILAIVTSLPAAAALGGTALTGIVSSLLGLNGARKTIAHIAAAASVCGLFFVGGYRLADNLADVARLEAVVAGAKAETARLQNQLDQQKLIGAFAAAERDQLNEDKQLLSGKVATYVKMLSGQPAAAVAACAVDDRDVRWRDSLRNGRAGRQ